MNNPIWTYRAYDVRVDGAEDYALRRAVGPHPGSPIPGRSRPGGPSTSHAQVRHDRLADLICVAGLIVVAVSLLALLAALGAGLFMVGKHVIELIWRSS